MITKTNFLYVKTCLAINLILIMIMKTYLLSFCIHILSLYSKSVAFIFYFKAIYDFYL